MSFEPYSVGVEQRQSSAVTETPVSSPPKISDSPPATDGSMSGTATLPDGSEHAVEGTIAADGTFDANDDNNSVSISGMIDEDGEIVSGTWSAGSSSGTLEPPEPEPAPTFPGVWIRYLYHYGLSSDDDTTWRSQYAIGAAARSAGGGYECVDVSVTVDPVTVLATDPVIVPYNDKAHRTPRRACESQYQIEVILVFCPAGEPSTEIGTYEIIATTSSGDSASYHETQHCTVPFGPRLRVSPLGGIGVERSPVGR